MTAFFTHCLYCWGCHHSHQVVSRGEGERRGARRATSEGARFGSWPRGRRRDMCGKKAKQDHGKHNGFSCPVSPVRGRLGKAPSFFQPGGEGSTSWRFGAPSLFQRPHSGVPPPLSTPQVHLYLTPTHPNRLSSENRQVSIDRTFLCRWLRFVPNINGGAAGKTDGPGMSRFQMDVSPSPRCHQGACVGSRWA